jgi:hypothetical protein
MLISSSRLVGGARLPDSGCRGVRVTEALGAGGCLFLVPAAAGASTSCDARKASGHERHAAVVQCGLPLLASAAGREGGVVGPQ